MIASVSSPDSDNFVRVGKVVKVHGIKGELKVLPYGDPDYFKLYKQLVLDLDEDGSAKVYDLVRARPQASVVIIQLAGLDDRNNAELLRGAEVWTEKKFLPEPAAEEIYWREMVGLEVVTDDGQQLGKVKALLETGGTDVLVIRGNGQEYLVPARKEFVVDLNNQDGCLVISVPPGLLEINS
ncbi:MAG: ribosome maturation factor RimM [Proteobacteria bacterium]|nr:ribosome maturation factor RimM [Pseudomonadota bacterium]MBU1714281.1 ribosome maturation factor RimM [Pseudomonadota bacterium]